MSGFLFDTNVLLDIATADPIWLPWSEKQFRSAAAQGPICAAGKHERRINEAWAGDEC
jgi:hypothetical protein